MSTGSGSITWRTADGWKVTRMRLAYVPPRDTGHDHWALPNHDGVWYAVDEPNGYLAGYTDSPEGLAAWLGEDYAGRLGMLTVQLRDAAGEPLGGPVLTSEAELREAVAELDALGVTWGPPTT